MSKSVRPASEVKPQSKKTEVEPEKTPSPHVEDSVAHKGEKPESSVVAGRPVRFMRNTGPITPSITFEDGTVFSFPSRTLKVLDSEEDKETIEKIRAVARKFRVYEDRN